MTLNLITGNNQIDILQQQFQLLHAGMTQKRKQFVIVPDKFSLAMEKSVMQSLGLTASMDFEVLTFARFASLMLDTSQNKLLTSLGATYIIQMIINKHKTELKCFNKTVKSVNFASVLFDSISQLKTCNITASDLLNASNKVQNKLLSAKLFDIAFVYQKYEEFLGSEYIDSANRLKLLSDKLSDCAEISQVDVHFCHFDNMTERGVDVIDKLIASAHSVSVGVLKPNAGQSNAYIYSDKFLKDMQMLAKKHSITPNIFEAKPTLSLAQNHIVEQLMSTKPTKVEIEKNTITPYYCNNVLSEVTMVASNIAYKIKNGQRYKDFVVNCTSIEAYAPIIRKVFKDFDIPCWIDLPFKLQDSELIKFLYTTFALFNNNFASEDILKFAKNVLSGISFEQQMLFERVINRYGIEHDLLWQDFSTQDEEYAQFLEIRNTFFAPVKTLKSNLQLCHTVGEYVTSIQNFMQETNLQQKQDEMCAKDQQLHDLWNESIDRQVFSKLNACLESLYNIMAEYQTSFDDFCKILQAGIQTVTISPLPMAIDCVYVGQNLQSVFEQTPFLYILGAHSDAFPAMVSDAGIISDLDIDTLKQQNVNLSPTISEINKRSIFSVVQNLALFTKQLFLSFPLESNGEQHSAGTVLNSLLSLFLTPNGALALCDAQTYVETQYFKDDEQHKLIFEWGNLHNALSSVIVESNTPESAVSKNLLSTAVKVLKECGFGAVFENLDKSGTVFAQKSNISKNILADQPHIGVTQLERYFQCPYQHFLDYGLKLQENETSDIAGLDNGNIIHAVLEQFVLYTNSHQKLSEKNFENVVGHIFDNVLNSPQFERFHKSGKNAFALKKLRAECVRACQAISFQLSHSQYKVKFVEKSFGSTGFVPNPEIVVLNQTIKIRGKVDRMDEWKGKYRIIDYKTSKNAGTFSLLDLYLGKKIQLFFYLHSVLKGMQAQGKTATAGGVYYLPIHREYTTENTAKQYDGFRLEGLTNSQLENIYASDDTLSPTNLQSATLDLTLSAKFAQGEVSARGNKLATDMQLNAILDYSNKIVCRALVEIAQGFVEPKPLSGTCDYCKYQHICKISCIENKKQRDKNFKVDIKSFEEIE